MANTKVAVRVHVFKSEGALRQYAFRHKADRYDHIEILLFNNKPYHIIDDEGLHAIPVSIGRLIAKQLEVEKYATKGAPKLQQIRLEPVEQLVQMVEYTFEE